VEGPKKTRKTGAGGGVPQGCKTMFRAIPLTGVKRGHRVAQQGGVPIGRRPVKGVENQTGGGTGVLLNFCFFGIKAGDCGASNALNEKYCQVRIPEGKSCNRTRENNGARMGTQKGGTR